MKKLFSGIRTFVKDEEGATAVEYGMMVGLIAVAIIVTVAAIGTVIGTSPVNQPWVVKLSDVLRVSLGVSPW
jgi:pilus assembly protein Flp/PilA